MQALTRPSLRRVANFVLGMRSEGLLDCGYRSAVGSVSEVMTAPISYSGPPFLAEVTERSAVYRCSKQAFVGCRTDGSCGLLLT